VKKAETKKFHVSETRPALMT